MILKLESGVGVFAWDKMMYMKFYKRFCVWCATPIAMISKVHADWPPYGIRVPQTSLISIKFG